MPPNSPRTVTLPNDELYQMLDIADEMVRFCSCWMPADRYYAVANAIWVIAHRAAGNDADADKLKADLMANRENYFDRPDGSRSRRRGGVI